MSEIIRELFRGNMEMLERPFEVDSRENAAFSIMETMTEEMKNAIPSEFHPLLEQYQNSMMELMDAACEEEFLSGYRLGVRMMIAAWPEDQNET